MRRFPRPDKGTPLLEADGRTIGQAWFDFLGYLDARGLADLPDVDGSSSAQQGQFLVYRAANGKFVFEPPISPTNGQTLVWDAANQQWTAV